MQRVKLDDTELRAQRGSSTRGIEKWRVVSLIWSRFCGQGEAAATTVVGAAASVTE
jgi:hypothetical protein